MAGTRRPTRAGPYLKHPAWSARPWPPGGRMAPYVSRGRGRAVAGQTDHLSRPTKGPEMRKGPGNEAGRENRSPLVPLPDLVPLSLSARRLSAFLADASFSSLIRTTPRWFLLSDAVWRLPSLVIPFPTLFRGFPRWLFSSHAVLRHPTLVILIPRCFAASHAVFALPRLFCGIPHCLFSSPTVLRRSSLVILAAR